MSEIKRGIIIECVGGGQITVNVVDLKLDKVILYGLLELAKESVKEIIDQQTSGSVVSMVGEIPK